MSLVKGPRYLRILTPRTKKGTIVQHDEFGRIRYRESFAAYSPRSIKAFNDENARRPTDLRHIIEIVENPHYKGNPMTTKRMLKSNPRPFGEREFATESVSEMESRIRAQLQKEFEQKVGSATTGNFPTLAEMDEERARKDARNQRDRERKERQKNEANGQPQTNAVDTGEVTQQEEIFPNNL